eukprot:GHVT01046964.1.p2 GENE.GHVT01046964.1~~GHVT01046964.1.p2  ORF type:complete len:139 (-),score=35.72 GHVT01046964.1:17-433(-)
MRALVGARARATADAAENAEGRTTHDISAGGAREGDGNPAVNEEQPAATEEEEAAKQADQQTPDELQVKPIIASSFRLKSGQAYRVQAADGNDFQSRRYQPVLPAPWANQSRAQSMGEQQLQQQEHQPKTVEALQETQ